MTHTSTAPELTGTERALLISILDTAASELRLEIRRTHTPDFRDALKEKQQLLLQVIEKLQS
jgi:hypothetical protein